MVSKTSSLLLDPPLRRRMHVRAHSDTSFSTLDTGDIPSPDQKPAPAMPDMQSHHRADDGLQLSPTEYETRSESSDDDAIPPSNPKASRQSPPRPHIDTTHLPAHADRPRSSSSPTSPNSRAWYEFDLAVVVALVSPIGNWLTGGDHIKNLLLIIFLIFYLHQIIEVPWSLYQKARPRRHPPHLPAPSVEDRYRQLAASELRALEFSFLALTALSPFLGATFLRYATAAIIGDEAVSWFSTALFVLATGMRPWSHVVDRLNQRTTDLHDVIHYLSADPALDDTRPKMEEMMKRVELLEKSLSKVKGKFMDATEEVYEYVDEAVDSVERAVRRHEKKYDKQETRVRDVEQTLETLKGKGKQKASGLSVNTGPEPPSLLSSILPAWVLAPPHRSLYPSSYSPSSRHSLRSFPSSSTMQLETIPEEEASKYPVMTRPSNIASVILSRAGYVATLPLRAVVRMVLRRY